MVSEVAQKEYKYPNYPNPQEVIIGKPSLPLPSIDKNRSSKSCDKADSQQQMEIKRLSKQAATFIANSRRSDTQARYKSVWNKLSSSCSQKKN